MNNPNGPYPGRQLFLGLTESNHPCFAYLVTGRSPESRERKAVPIDNTIRMGPTGNAPYDPLRHYSAVKFDSLTSVLAVSNGIQTEAVYELYKLLVNVNSAYNKDYLEKVLDGANAEPDSYHTPRIAGIIIPGTDKIEMIVGIKSYGQPARAYQVISEPGKLNGVSTYNGNIDKPEARDPNSGLTNLKYQSKTAKELAEYIFEISEVLYKDNDIRVCTIGGVLDNNKWELAIKNTH